MSCSCHSCHSEASNNNCPLEHSHHEHSHHNHEHSHNNSEVIKFAIAIVFFLLAFAFKFFARNLNFYGVKLYIPFFVLSWLISGYEVVLTPIKNFSKGIIFDENFLMSVATIGAFILGDWTEAASVMLFYNLGEIAQGAIIEKARKSIVNVAELNSSFARVLKNHESEEGLNDEANYEIKEPKDVEISSTLLVKPGEKIPLDAIVIKGTSELNTASMTGESLPRKASVGDEVLSGFVNLTGLLVLKTTAILKDTEASKMLKLIEKAQERKTKTEKLITSFAKVYTPIVLILALTISIFPPVFTHYFLNISIVGFSSFSTWIHRGLVFLVISCPCAFILSVPLAYFAGLGAFARNGILVKGADYIDGISKVGKVVFDKTGTLTLGNMEVAKVANEKMVSEQDLIMYASLAESASNHPIAKAIKKFSSFSKKFENETKYITDYQEQTGKGIKCKFKGLSLCAGSASFIEEELKQNIVFNEEIGSHVCVSYDGKYLGSLILRDEIKHNAKMVIEQLRKLGVKDVSMLTGDVEKVAKDVASSLNLNSYKAELLPREKVEVFEKEAKVFKEKNNDAKVIFVGDGINDAAVLSVSDVGCAIGEGATAAAMEASDVVFLNDDLSLLAKAIMLSKRTRSIVKQNIAISLSIKIGFLLLGSLGVVGLQLAVLADVGVALLATLNSIRLKR
ncbi:MAG: heavy metal translocating P-type ATPase [Treponema sp.]